MMMRPKFIFFLIAVCYLALLAPSAIVRPAAADEGMWTFDNPPLKQLREKYGFEPTKEWLDHVRFASVRFNDGGSGSFVSPHGLVITNHHVAAGQLQKASKTQIEYLKGGFYEKTRRRQPRRSNALIWNLTSWSHMRTSLIASAARSKQK